MCGAIRPLWILATEDYIKINFLQDVSGIQAFPSMQFTTVQPQNTIDVRRKHQTFQRRRQHAKGIQLPPTQPIHRTSKLLPHIHFRLNHLQKFSNKNFTCISFHPHHISWPIYSFLTPFSYYFEEGNKNLRSVSSYITVLEDWDNPQQHYENLKSLKILLFSPGVTTHCGFVFCIPLEGL